MPHGFEFYKSNGALAVTSDAPCYRLITSGAVGYTGAFTAANSGLVINTNGYTAPLVFLRPSVGTTVVIKETGAAGTFELRCDSYCEYRIYSADPAPASGGWGLQLYNAGQVVTFDSENSYASLCDASSYYAQTTAAPCAFNASDRFTNPYPITLASFGSISGGADGAGPWICAAASRRVRRARVGGSAGKNADWDWVERSTGIYRTGGSSYNFVEMTTSLFGIFTQNEGTASIQMGPTYVPILVIR
jgi:hypothetical protein